MLEKVATHSGVTRQHESSGSSSPNTPGRLISNRVFVGNIPPNLVERDLIMLFHRFGKIRDVKIIPEHTRNKSYGFVTFFSEADARRAIQASVQNDSVMWGDRKLNVAPAIKRANSNNPNSLPASSNGFYQTPNRLANNSFYATPVPVPAVNTMYTSAGIVSPTEQNQSVDHMQVDSSSNPMYQTAVICRLPHQYAMAQCHQYSSSSGHYFVSPGFQPYVQTGSPIPAGHQASHYASYASITAMPMTPPCSSTSRENIIGTDVQSDMCVDSSGGDSGSQGGVDGGEKSAVEVLGNDSSNEVSQLHQQAGVNDSPYPLHTTIMCCPHHSCMLSPISPIQHMPNQAVAAAGLARSCLSLHGHPGNNCPYPPNSPLIYSSPMVYNPARRSSSARLQRWNSLDANLTGLSHGHHHQSPNGYWGNESSWSRPSLLDDSYGSETGIYQGPRGFDRPLRPAFSCQSHHGGMFSPFCRSYEYNIWGQGHAPNNGSIDYVDQSGSPSTTAPSQTSMSAQSHSSLALNLSESGTEQVQQNSKK